MNTSWRATWSDDKLIYFSVVLGHNHVSVLGSMQSFYVCCRFLNCFYAFTLFGFECSYISTLICQLYNPVFHGWMIDLLLLCHSAAVIIYDSDTYFILLWLCIHLKVRSVGDGTLIMHLKVRSVGDGTLIIHLKVRSVGDGISFDTQPLICYVNGSDCNFLYLKNNNFTYMTWCNTFSIIILLLFLILYVKQPVIFILLSSVSAF